MDYKNLKLKNVIAELFRLYRWPSLVWWVMSGYIEVTCHEYIIIGVWKLQPLINTNRTRLMKACKVIQPKYFSCKIYYFLVKSFQMIIGTWIHYLYICDSYHEFITLYIHINNDYNIHIYNINIIKIYIFAHKKLLSNSFLPFSLTYLLDGPSASHR